MIKIKDTVDSISSELLLWNKPQTDISVQNVYHIPVHPVSSIFSDASITFNIPPQPKGMLKDILIKTKFKVQKDGADLTNDNQCTVINNFANALWELVDIHIADRTELSQSMRNSYAYQTFFMIVLNEDRTREDALFNNELFLMDSGRTKKESENLLYHEAATVTASKIKNVAASKRSKRIAQSKSTTVYSKLHNPLFSTNKALPTNMKIRLTLHKNADKFLLMADNTDYEVKLEEVTLDVKFIRPSDVMLSMIEERLSKEAAPYYISKPEMIIKPLGRTGRYVRMNNIFPGRLPHHAFFCVQRTDDFVGNFTTNPFTFIPINKFQFFVNGSPYFNEELDIPSKLSNHQTLYEDNSLMLNQLYKCIGKDIRGAPLITSKNFQLNYIIGLSLTPDQSGTSAPYLSAQSEASTQLEFDLVHDTTASQDLLLIIFAVYDRVVKINSLREIEIIE